ncbi:hypothetical protein PCASD_25472, partial [Puccinia coronata f. sp. avenae]
MPYSNSYHPNYLRMIGNMVEWSFPDSTSSTLAKLDNRATHLFSKRCWSSTTSGHGSSQTYRRNGDPASWTFSFSLFFVLSNDFL